MDKPCYYSYVIYDKPTGDCSIDKCCFRDDGGRKWESCDAGKLHIARLKKRSQVKSAKARRIREEIFEYFKSNFTGLIYPHVLKNKTKSAITKIIKKHL